MGDQLAIDYAWRHPSPAAIVQAGYTAVIRYVSQDPSKDLTDAEAADLHSHGLVLGVVFETTATRATESTVAGITDGRAMANRLSALGAPAGTPALVNVGDWAVQPGHLGAIQAYYAAYRDQLGEYQPGAGGYGTAGVIEHLASLYPGDIWWQNAIDSLGLPGDVVSSHASIYQRVHPTHDVLGYEGDYDEDVYGFGPRPNLGWWGAGAPAPAPVPAPGGDMQTPPTIQQGSVGPEVRNAQALLFGRGYRLGNTGVGNTGIDSEFGPLTSAAVHEYQQYVGIASDGVIGPITWTHLLGNV